MNRRYEIQILQASLSESGPQADALVIEPNGDIHHVRCLCRPNGNTDIGEPPESKMMEYLVGRYGSQLVADLRETTCRACPYNGA